MLTHLCFFYCLKQCLRTLNQLHQQRFILVHVAFIFRQIAALMAQRKQPHLNLAGAGGMNQALKNKIALV